MSDGIFGISITGLRAAQMGLTTAGHNITNASTPGYNRQEIVQSTNTPLYTGAGFLGQGTNVSTVKRVYSQFLDNQVQSAQTKSSYLDTYYAQISQLDNMLADPSAGLSPALQDFFSGVNDAAANPASVPSRQSMLSSSDALVSRFQALDQRFREIRNGVNSQITSSVSLINSYAQQIATLNHQVVIAEAGGNGQPPNDILDQRDKLIADLNKEINVSVVKQDNGSYNVFMGKGQALVVGQQAMTLKAMPMPDDPESMGVAYVNYGGSAQMLSSDSLDGGSLGGLLAFRSETLDKAQNELGRVAIGLAQTFNDQHRLGQDLNGDLGGYYFNVRGASGASGQNAFPSAKVVSNAQNSTPVLPLVATPPAVTLTDVTSVTTSDYRLVQTAGGFTLTRLSDNTALFSNAALPQTVDGLTIAAPVNTSAGDGWLIQPTRDGAKDISVAIRDTAKIAAAAPIRTAATDANTGSGKISAGVVNPPPPTNVNLQQAVTITFHTPYDGQFDVTGTGAGLPANNQVYTEGADITYNGWTVQINGTPAANDSFTVGPNTGGVADNRNALLLAGLQTKNTLGKDSSVVGSEPTATYQSAYSQIVSSIGVKSRDISVTGQAQASLVAQTQQAQQSMSGVNLDEEAANLLRYQQAYQASGKMMEIATTLFDTLLSLGR
ncbi:MAG: flagellar hook-associated protein FlgK [Gammaproteobacteria bacterium]|nr:flagellar hook-associated protein FlgK [Gammaproteobacteria bacterium]MBU1730962.1 flagellar hook-associated protein FlgK [Gammaproteobacteria bacterium]MBU1893622.1 flagellar hook-associated protein FlgK [Gammaproteobacteria bacterium]